MFDNIVIFDLDGTTIDSSHRHATHADGTLNLDAWIENATPEKIFQDQVLPLGHLVSKIGKRAYTIICTLGFYPMQIMSFLWKMVSALIRLSVAHQEIWNLMLNSKRNNSTHFYH